MNRSMDKVTVNVQVLVGLEFCWCLRVCWKPRNINVVCCKSIKRVYSSGCFGTQTINRVTND